MKKQTTYSPALQRKEEGLTIWKAKQTYNQNDIVIDGQTGYTAIRIATNPNPDNETVPPSSSPYWSLLRLIPDWLPNVNFSEDFIVEYGGSFYKSTVAHTSSANFSTDASMWSQIGGGGSGGSVVDWDLSPASIPATLFLTPDEILPIPNQGEVTGDRLLVESTGGQLAIGIGTFGTATLTNTADIYFYCLFEAGTGEISSASSGQVIFSTDFDSTPTFSLSYQEGSGLFSYPAGVTFDSGYVPGNVVLVMYSGTTGYVSIVTENGTWSEFIYTPESVGAGLFVLSQPESLDGPCQLGIRISTENMGSSLVPFEGYVPFGSIGESSLPEGISVGDELTVTVAGSYQGIEYEIGDGATFVDAGTLQVTPKGASRGFVYDVVAPISWNNSPFTIPGPISLAYVAPDEGAQNYGSISTEDPNVLIGHGSTYNIGLASLGDVPDDRGVWWAFKAGQNTTSCWTGVIDYDAGQFPMFVIGHNEDGNLSYGVGVDVPDTIIDYSFSYGDTAIIHYSPADNGTIHIISASQDWSINGVGIPSSGVAVVQALNDNGQVTLHSSPSLLPNNVVPLSGYSAVVQDEVFDPTIPNAANKGSVLIPENQGFFDGNYLQPGSDAAIVLDKDEGIILPIKLRDPKMAVAVPLNDVGPMLPQFGPNYSLLQGQGENQQILSWSIPSSYPPEQTRHIGICSLGRDMSSPVSQASDNRACLVYEMQTYVAPMDRVYGDYDLFGIGLAVYNGGSEIDRTIEIGIGRDMVGQAAIYVNGAPFKQIHVEDISKTTLTVSISPETYWVNLALNGIDLGWVNQILDNNSTVLPYLYITDGMADVRGYGVSIGLKTSANDIAYPPANILSVDHYGNRINRPQIIPTYHDATYPTMHTLIRQEEAYFASNWTGQSSQLYDNPDEYTPIGGTTGPSMAFIPSTNYPNFASLPGGGVIVTEEFTIDPEFVSYNGNPDPGIFLQIVVTKINANVDTDRTVYFELRDEAVSGISYGIGSTRFDNSLVLNLSNVEARSYALLIYFDDSSQNGSVDYEIRVFSVYDWAWVCAGGRLPQFQPITPSREMLPGDISTIPNVFYYDNSFYYPNSNTRWNEGGFIYNIEKFITTQDYEFYDIPFKYLGSVPSSFLLDGYCLTRDTQFANDHLVPFRGATPVNDTFGASRAVCGAGLAEDATLFIRDQSDNPIAFIEFVAGNTNGEVRFVNGENGEGYVRVQDGEFLKLVSDSAPATLKEVFITLVGKSKYRYRPVQQK